MGLASGADLVDCTLSVPPKPYGRKLDEAKSIYRAKYWTAQRCDELPPGVDDSIFDYGVNSGLGRSGKVLRRVVGLPDKMTPIGRIEAHG